MSYSNSNSFNTEDTKLFSVTFEPSDVSVLMLFSGEGAPLRTGRGLGFALLLTPLPDLRPHVDLTSQLGQLFVGF